MAKTSTLAKVDDLIESYPILTVGGENRTKAVKAT
mgnify:CR=1 FL=1